MPSTDDLGGDLELCLLPLPAFVAMLMDLHTRMRSLRERKKQCQKRFWHKKEVKAIDDALDQAQGDLFTYQKVCTHRRADGSSALTASFFGAACAVCWADPYDRWEGAPF